MAQINYINTDGNYIKTKTTFKFNLVHISRFNICILYQTNDSIYNKITYKKLSMSQYYSIKIGT